jgi:cell division protein ZapB
LTYIDVKDYIKITGEAKLDNEFILGQFEKIEKKVERLIEVCKSHEATNLELTYKIKSLEEELQAKVEAEKKFAQEKALIRSKIDNLLDRLEEELTATQA